MPQVLAVHRSPTHTFSKYPQPSIHLLAGLGVEGDAHCGATVRHRYLVRKDPTRPNRAQVHLLESEFLDTLAAEALESLGTPEPPILPGRFGENITTRGLPLCTLPVHTRLHLGPSAVVELLNLRSPCRLMNDLRPGLMKRSFHPNTRTPRAGVLAIVHQGGTIHPNDPIHIELPPAPHHPLQPA